MARLFQFPKYSFGTKILLSFIFFIFIFLFIRFSLIVPKVEKQAYNNEIQTISRTLQYIKEQIITTGFSIEMQSELETQLIQQKIESEIMQLKYENKRAKTDALIQRFDNSNFSKFCGYKLSGKNIHHQKIAEVDLFHKNDVNNLDNWIVFDTGVVYKSYKATQKHFFYNTKFNENFILSLSCDPITLNPNHSSFEELLKSHLQKNLTLTQSTNNSTTILAWINHELANEDNRPLYEQDELLMEKRYMISYLSNAKNLTTGDLTTKEILASKGKGPIEHMVDNEAFVTWVVDLEFPEPDDFFIFIYSVKKEDLLQKSSANLFVLLPETLTAILIALILILFLFQRLFKNINTLTLTALKVKQGEINIRSNVKGEDDIGILGEAFDSMLSFFENSIKILDLKVEEKTQQIQKSLEEKETLLKEIHHRVKNNLAKTVTLIELQERDVKDENTKKALVDIKERIYTMELLHRKLYESANLNEIVFKEYLIDLVDAILTAYHMENSVEVIYEIEDMELNIETAMPLGLVINELITNAIKYAFTNNPVPKLNINVIKKEEKLTMVIHDNGAGLNEAFSYQSKTLGLKLINTIVRFQLFGEVEYVYDNGAKFIITGKIKKQNTDITFS